PDAAPDAAPEGPIVYPNDRHHAPITEEIAASLRALAGRRTDVFAKVGDSITVSSSSLHCFASDRVDLADHEALSETLDLFRGGAAGETTPFDRSSLSATSGWSVGRAVEGEPSPVEAEVAAIDPRFAVIMFGTNDIQNRSFDTYATGMRTLVDGLLAEGVIPLLSTVPARRDNADADAEVAAYNAAVRGLAQSRLVPFMDYHLMLRDVPNGGLGGDGIHPNSYATPAGVRPCVFTEAGLQFGYNVRNLLTLESLDRVRRALQGPAVPDASAPRRFGEGTAASPILIAGTPALPFADVVDTRLDGESRHSRYACHPEADEGGHEVVYQLELEAPAVVRARVADGPGVDIDLHLLADPDDAASCLDRDDRDLTASLEAGTWYLVLDTYVQAGMVLPGEVVFVVTAE
ncbi:MAG: SGNH/GDSL hydrolase family protein, partial [Myxococcales bacterium]|nr:SGNH/GDSL hydrolase family protein [Myxococcales bacterium]